MKRMGCDRVSKVVVTMVMHETNTFSPLPTSFQDFSDGATGNAPPEGDDAIRCFGQTNTAFAAFLDLAAEQGWEADVPIAALAIPGGRVSDDAFERLAGLVLGAVARGCDAILLDLHGAMVTDSHDDGEGELLHRIRQIAPEVPIAVALDFHANLSDRMVQNATILSGYRTYPHVDKYETGKRVGALLVRLLREDISPAMVWTGVPLLSAMLCHAPDREPMRAVLQCAIDIQERGDALDASVFGGFPLADTADTGLSCLLVVESGAHGAQELCDRVARNAWDRREAFIFRGEPVSASVSRAGRAARHPVLLIDHGDNCGAGGGADDMTVFAEVVRQGLGKTIAGPIHDPEAVARARNAGVGRTLKLSIGGNPPNESLALDLTFTVRAVSEGRFRITGPVRTGFKVDLGGTALLSAGPVDLVVSNRRCEPLDLGYFTHLGIELRDYRNILLKSRQHYRACFEPLVSETILVSGPGICASDPAVFRYERLSRPIYPLDAGAEFVPGGNHRRPCER